MVALVPLVLTVARARARSDGVGRGCVSIRLAPAFPLVQAIVSAFGAESSAAKRAVALVRGVLEGTLATQARDAYAGNAVVQVAYLLVDRAGALRPRRAAAADGSGAVGVPGYVPAPPSQVGSSFGPYTVDMWPVTFWIVLFVSVSLLLTLTATSVSLLTMDPGHDSIIYRVTSQHAKTD